MNIIDIITYIFSAIAVGLSAWTVWMNVQIAKWKAEADEGN